MRRRVGGGVDEDEDIDDGLGPELHVAQNPVVIFLMCKRVCKRSLQVDNADIQHSHDSERDAAPVMGFRHLTHEDIKAENTSKRDSHLSHETSSRHSSEAHRTRHSGFYDMLVPDEEADVIP